MCFENICKSVNVVYKFLLVNRLRFDNLSYFIKFLIKVLIYNV